MVGATFFFWLLLTATDWGGSAFPEGGIPMENQMLAWLIGTEFQIST